MAILPGNAASYFWQGVHADRPTPTNVAPNTVCRAFETDTQTWWMWSGSMWMLEGTHFVPPPGPTPQRACNIAGYLSNVVIRQSLQKALDSIGFNTTVLGFGSWILAIIPGMSDVDIAMFALNALYTAIVGGTQGDYTDALADDSLFSRITCAIYSAIEADGQVTEANYPTILANIAAVTYTHSDVITTIHQYVQDLGYPGLSALQNPGALASYDCTGCGGTGSTGPTGAPITYPHKILSKTHVDTVVDTAAEGDALVYRSSNWVHEAGVPISSYDANIVDVDFTEQSADPTTPGAGHRIVYAKSNGVYERDSAGVVTLIGPGATGGTGSTGPTGGTGPTGPTGSGSSLNVQLDGADAPTNPTETLNFVEGAGISIGFSGSGHTTDVTFSATGGSGGATGPTGATGATGPTGGTMSATRYSLATGTFFANTWTDLPTETMMPAAGTYVVWGSILVQENADASGDIAVRFSDGTTTQSSGELNIATPSSPGQVQIPPCIVATDGSTVYQLAALHSTAAGATALVASTFSGESHVSELLFLKIA